MKNHIKGKRIVKITAWCGMLSAITALLLAALCILPARASDITPDDTFEVTETLIEIEIAERPTKTIYDIGETLDASGLKIKLKYNSGRTETIDGDPAMCSGFDSSSAGEKEVTVAYRGLTTSFKVDVRTVTAVSISKKPNKTEYYAGEALDLNGLTITVEYSAGPSEAVDSGYTLVEGSRLDKEGEHTVTVQYLGKRVSFTVTVKPPVPTDAKLTSLPTKTEYSVGDSFDGSGAAFTVTYSNGTTAVITDGIEFSGFSSAEKGDVTVTAKWQDFTATFTVKVNYSEHTHIAGGDREIIKQPTCTETGKAVRYCKICGEVAESATLKKLAHTYGDWVVTKEPTGTSEGEITLTCQVCGDVQTNVLHRLSHEISDGANGSVTASGDYFFPYGSALSIKNVMPALSPDEIKRLETQAGRGVLLAGVYSVTAGVNGQALVPPVSMTVKLSVPADIAELTDLRVLCGDSSIDAKYENGYVTFTADKVLGQFAIAGVKRASEPTTGGETTGTVVPPSPETSDPTPSTSSPESPDGTTAPAPPDGSAPNSGNNAPGANTGAPAAPGSAEPTPHGNNKVGNAIKTIIIVIVVIVVIGALFELLYLYLKNKFLF